MKSGIRLIQLLIVVASIFCIAPAVFAVDAGKPDGRPAVEFVVKDGTPCLGAVVHGAAATIDDYRAGETRWLASAYPGVAAPRWETVLVLAPSQKKEVAPESVTVRRETAHLENGKTVCFDIHVAEASDGTSDD